MLPLTASKRPIWCTGAIWVSGNWNSTQVIWWRKGFCAWFLKLKMLLMACLKLPIRARSFWKPIRTWWLSWTSALSEESAGGFFNLYGSPSLLQQYEVVFLQERDYLVDFVFLQLHLPPYFFYAMPLPVIEQLQNLNHFRCRWSAPRRICLFINAA